MKRSIPYILTLLVISSCFLFSTVQAQPTTIHGYEFTTGVDSSLWVDMTVSTPWMPLGYATYQLPFSFFFYDMDYTEVNMCRDGSLLFSQGRNGPYSFFPNQVGQIGGEAAGVFGYRNDYTNDYTLVCMRNTEYGSEGHRVVVIQMGSFLNHDVANLFQIQLREEDNSITIVYGEREFIGNTPVSIGLLFDTNHMAIVNQNSHTVSDHASATAPTSWPGQYRYYRFVPSDSLCPKPRDLSAELVWYSDNDIRLMWSPCSIIDSFRVEYGLTGFSEGSGISMMVHRPPVVVPDVHTTEEMEARVYAQCTYGESDYIGATFTTCPIPTGLSVARGISLTNDNPWLWWDSIPQYHSYRVEYGPLGFAEGTGTNVMVNSAQIVLSGLPAGVEIEVRVYAVCTYGESDYASIVFHTPCQQYADSKIHFANIYSDSVKCCTGTFTAPGMVYSPPNIVDFGSESYLSRHTVHSDTSERDPRTDYRLRTVPEGFCMSVRLGNWLCGAEQEAIFYTLNIDTNQYDLLVLRYALVEQNPNHDAEEQPRFEFDITDTLGNSISSCYHGNFISGDLSGWNSVVQDSYNQILWRDWDAVGVDLTPLHGQTIVVSLSNYDCSLGGHYGYAYFTLETGSKRILAESCGDAIVNTFRAPEGFSYHWYSMSDTATTLSTADTLHVTTAGDYGCHVTYQLSNQVCGFNLSTYAGGRYPVALFDIQSVDSCGSTTRFVNQSYIARDSAHTLQTNFPCDEYLWVIDDSITTTTTSPTLCFDEGTHTVTLYAMLANGACVDTTTQTFIVAFHHDTIRAVVCEGSSYRFFEQILFEAGEYHDVNDCQHTVLYLEVKPVYDLQVYDTFLLGSTYQFDETHYSQPGLYTLNYTTVRGCDSTIRLYLSCIDVRDTVVCSSFMPLEWNGVTFVEAGSDTLHHLIAEGVDNIVVQNLQVLNPPALDIVTEVSCHEQGGYLLSLPDTLCYQWASSPADSLLPPTQFPVFLSPTDTITYYLTVDRCDTLPCPLRDTFLLTPVAAVDARLAVSPVQLDEDHLDFTATDLTVQPHQRQWYFNSFPLLSTDSTVEYHASVSDDSVLVMLVTNTDVCTDTATRLVLVNIQSLWFPNVFTPRAIENNLFRGYGTQVRDYDLRVYSRWANCIFHTSDINEGWDGTYRGKECPVGTYLYICHYTTLEGELQTASGVVTLLN